MLISVFDNDSVENIVGKGENAGYQHFLLFPQCFEKASFPDTSKGVIVWECVKCVEQNHTIKGYSALSMLFSTLLLVLPHHS